MTGFRLCNAIAACLNSFDKGDSNMLLKRYTLPLILTAISVVPATARAEGCIQSSLNGAYGFVSSVRIVPPGPQDRTTRQNVVAVVVYDGAGIVRLAGS